MYNNKEEAMREEARNAIIEALQDGFSGYYSELHNEVFNTDYYIIGTYKAQQALEEFGVFKAIEKVKEYETDRFGAVYTDFTNPEEFANMLYYIIGEEVLFEMMEGVKPFHDNWDDVATDETNAAILAALKEGKQ